MGDIAERPLADLRVWLVHDWLTGMRGGEKVLLEMVRLFPQARIATLFWVPGSVDSELERRVAQTSFLQHIPGISRCYRNLLPLMPTAMGRMRLGTDGQTDLVISSSHCVAKGVGLAARIPHICYCHTPMRYIWGMQNHYFSDRRISLKLAAMRIFRGSLQRADLASNQTVTRFVANSRNVAERINRCYHRPADVIHPGFDEQFFTLPPDSSQTPRDDYYLMVSALVPYKRVDLAIEAFANSPRRLVIVGQGPEEKRLRALAGNPKHITFLGHQPNEILRQHYQRCAALIFPGEEDFGMVPLEAQACGAPVIAYGAGGILETVLPWSQDAQTATGVFFPNQTAPALRTALDIFEHHRPAFPPEAIRQHALQFRWTNFRHAMTQLVRQTLSPANKEL